MAPFVSRQTWNANMGGDNETIASWVKVHLSSIRSYENIHRPSKIRFEALKKIQYLETLLDHILKFLTLPHQHSRLQRFPGLRVWAVPADHCIHLNNKEVLQGLGCNINIHSTNIYLHIISNIPPNLSVQFRGCFFRSLGIKHSPSPSGTPME